MSTSNVRIDMEEFERNRKSLVEILLKEFPEHEDQINNLEFRPGIDNITLIKSKSIEGEFKAKIKAKYPDLIFPR